MTIGWLIKLADQMGKTLRMVWPEIDVDRPLTDADLRRAAGHTFGIAPERVQVVSNLATDITALDPGISLVVEHWRQPGDFPERVAFVMWDGDLLDMVGAKEDSTESHALLTSLASHLNASIIAPDSDASPNTGLLIEPSGNVYRVEFDESELDGSGGISLPDKTQWVRVPELSHLPQRHLLTS